MPLARLRGPYQAMATIAFVEIVIAVVFQWESVTGGAAGLNGIPKSIQPRPSRRVRGAWPCCSARCCGRPASVVPLTPWRRTRQSLRRSASRPRSATGLASSSAAPWLASPERSSPVAPTASHPSSLARRCWCSPFPPSCSAGATPCGGRSWAPRFSCWCRRSHGLWPRVATSCTAYCLCVVIIYLPLGLVDTAKAFFADRRLALEREGPRPLLKADWPVTELLVAGRVEAVRWRGRGERPDTRAGIGPHHRPDWSKRRGQDHHGQSHDRHHCAHKRQHSPERCCRVVRRHAGPGGAAWGRSHVPEHPAVQGRVRAGQRRRGMSPP